MGPRPRTNTASRRFAKRQFSPVARARVGASIGDGGSMKAQREGINALAKPSGTGCVECLAAGTWWFHLRRCTQCGHIGCCDSSPNQHASKHSAATGHPIITSFEPGERWFYDYRSGEFFAGPTLPAPHSHPLDQPVPGPAGRVPSDWQTLLHD
jgi:hypothetical protein